jgi:hypothetical protein
VSEGQHVRSNVDVGLSGKRIAIANLVSNQVAIYELTEAPTRSPTTSPVPYLSPTPSPTASLALPAAQLPVRNGVPVLELVTGFAAFALFAIIVAAVLPAERLFVPHDRKLYQLK